MSQTLTPSLYEIFDPSVNDKILPASSTVDETGNTYISTKINYSSSGLMKISTDGNIIWQKKLPYFYTENQISYYNSFDSKNISYKANDGIYFTTMDNTSGMWGGNTPKFYLSKVNAANGSFYWHIYCSAPYHPENKSMLINIQNGVYWMFSNKIILISPTGTKVFSKTLSPDVCIISATAQPNGQCYINTFNNVTGQNSILKMDSSGNITSSFTLSDPQNIFTFGSNSPYSKIEYYQGNIYMSYGKDQGSGLIKIDTNGTILAANQWRYGAGNAPYTLKSGTWTIYNNEIVFSQTSLNGQLDGFSRLNIFSRFDLNLNQIQTFSIPHFSTYGNNSYSGTDPYFPETFTINNGYLQVIGSKGDQVLRNLNFLRIDSTFIFKSCNNIIADSIPNYTVYTVTSTADTLSTTTTNDTLHTFFPLSNNTQFSSIRNDIKIESILTSNSPCGSCNSQANASISGETAVVYYNWGTESGNQTNNPATNLCPGNYSLVISDNYGCQDSSAFEILAAAPIATGLCLTTVDSLSTHNILVWEKPISNVIEGFNIYREITANNFQFLTFVDYDSLSEYHDLNANPNITNYRYKLTTVDTCGSESAFSDYHSTIHLQLLGNGNMQWTLYDIENQGNPVSFYNVYRDDLGNGNWALLTGSLPGTNSTYTDVNFAGAPNAKYRVDVNWALSCSSSRTTINTTRSNIKAAGLSTIGISENELDAAIQIFPNPASENIYISLPLFNEQITITVYNSLGEAVLRKASGNTSESINISNMAKGVYTISFQTAVGNLHKKLIIQ